MLLVAVAFTLTWILYYQFGFIQQLPFGAVEPVLQVVQTIALDSGLLHGPANTILAAQRAVEAGALALNVDVVLAQGVWVKQADVRCDVHRTPLQTSEVSRTSRCFEGKRLGCSLILLEMGGDRLVAAHNATHWLPMGGFPTFSCGSLSFCQPKDLDSREWCQVGCLIWGRSCVFPK